MNTPQGPWPKAARLRRRSEFVRLRAAGTKLRCGPLRLQWTANGTAVTRVGITVPKFHGLAPLRNRIKRVVREAWRCVRDQFPAGLDIVILVDVPEPCTRRDAVVDLLLRARARMRP